MSATSEPEGKAGETLESPGLHRASRLSSAPAISGFRVSKGMTLGDFTLVQLLGRGGMGEVWEAEQASLARRVALKLLLPERVDQKGLDFFAREARAGGRLSHPGIVAIHGTGEDEGLHWIAMELVEDTCDLRRSMEALREEEELPGGYYQSVAGFVAQVAEALEVAHTAGVIHRDLKPGNILVTRDDQPKVSDFGLAKLVDEQSLSIAGDLVGTYFYMSPEQVAAKRIGIDHRTDVFSLGVVLYEMLTLSKPFVGDTTEQVAHKILLVDPPAPDELRSKVPRDLSVICGKALEKDPDSRYSSMAEFASDLRRHLAHEPIHARPPTLGQRVVKWARRNPTVSVGAAVAAVAVTVISWLGLVALDRAEEARKEKAATEVALKQVEVARATTQAALETAERERLLAHGRSYTANIHAATAEIRSGNVVEGRRLLAACPEGLRGWEYHHLLFRSDLSLRRLGDHGKQVLTVDWDLDGKRVATGASDCKVRVWRVETGELLQVLLGPHEVVMSVAWGPLGKRLVAGFKSGEVVVWDVETGDILHSFTGHEDSVTQVAWRPDGARLASSSRDRSIRIWDVQTGLPARAPLTQPASVEGVSWNPAGTRVAAVCYESGNPVRIWDVQTGEQVLSFTVYSSMPGFTMRSTNVPFGFGQCVDWSPTGDLIVTGASNERVNVWSAETGELRHSFKGSGLCVSWDPTGRLVASGGLDHVIRIWNVTEGRQVRELVGHGTDVFSIAWAPSGDRVVTGAQGTTARIWDAAAGHIAKTSGRHLIRAASWNPDGTQYASAGQDGLRIWDARTGDLLREGDGPKASIYGMSWSPVGDEIITGSNDKMVHSWDAETGALVQTFPGHGAGVVAVAWSPEGSRFASGAEDGGIRVWDRESGKVLHELAGPEGAVNSLAWDPGGARLAAGASDGTVRIYDGETGESLLAPMGHGAPVFSVAWCPNGVFLASGSSDNKVRLWDPQTGQLLHTLSGHQARVRCVTWNPSGDRLASCSEDKTIRVWKVPTGDLLQTLRGSTARVTSVEWDPTGRRILSSSFDGTVRTWESRMEDALEVWRAELDRTDASRLVESLFSEHHLLELVQEKIGTDLSLPENLRSRALQLAGQRGETKAMDLNNLAWKLVDPEREGPEADVEHGLRLARAAVKSDPTRASFCDTLAWALLANGQLDEALKTSQKALDLASEELKEEYKGHLDRLRAAVERANLAPSGSAAPGDGG